MCSRQDPFPALTLRSDGVVNSLKPELMLLLHGDSNTFCVVMLGNNGLNTRFIQCNSYENLIYDQFLLKC